MRINQDVYERICKITFTDYEALYDKDPDVETVIVFEEAINSMLEDLICEIDRLEEKYEDLQQDLQDNYKRIPASEQVGVTDRDFM